MTLYRINILDVVGAIVSGSDGDFLTDGEACAAAEGMLRPGERAEVRNAARLVGLVAVPAAAKSMRVGTPKVAETPRNHLLRRLPADEFEWIRPYLSKVELVSGQVLYERDSLIEHAYFVEHGMVSVVSRTEEEDLGIEIGVVGAEGLVGCVAMFDDAPISFCHTLVQLPGTALRIPVAKLMAGAAINPVLRNLGFRYIQAQLIHASQSAACNALHPLHKRAARWLLIAHDRADGNVLTLTQEFLANMLGVRRPGVTVAAQALQDAGLIDYSRGRITIIDRPGLEHAACGCYQIVRAEYERLLEAD